MNFHQKRYLYIVAWFVWNCLLAITQKRDQYLVCPPLALMTAWHLFRMEAKYFRQTSADMLFHVPTPIRYGAVFLFSRLRFARLLRIPRHWVLLFRDSDGGRHPTFFLIFVLRVLYDSVTINIYLEFKNWNRPQSANSLNRFEFTLYTLAKSN